jgi:hypothetical protein
MSDTAIDYKSLFADGRWGAVPAVVALVLVLSLWLRYAHPWAENDTVVLSRAARAVQNQGTITPTEFAYDHGFAYPTLVAAISTMTGVQVKDVQVGILPWLTLVTALVAFIAFRSMMGSGKAGAIAASLLLVQPDFLFVSQRGSHEKMTWTLVLTLLFCLLTSLQGRRLREAVPYVVAFYLSGFAMLTTNAFFGSSFTTIILLSLAGGLIATRRFFRVQASRRVIPRLGYVFLVLSALTYVIVFYLYEPAGTNLGNLARVVDRLAALYLNVDTDVENRVAETAQIRSNAQVSQSETVQSPYANISLAWTSTLAFAMLTLFTWLMIVAAVLTWLLLTVTFVRRGVARSELSLFLVWAFAASAGVQIAMSVTADFAGALGSNLQLRLVPVFNVFAIPMVVAAASRYRIPEASRAMRWAVITVGFLIPIVTAVAYPPATIAIAVLLVGFFYVANNWDTSIWAKRLALGVGVCAFVYFAGAAVLKASNDPLVSNKWTFYDGSEALAVRWVNAYQPNLFIHGDVDERIGAASVLEAGDSGAPEAQWSRSTPASVRLFLFSDVIVRRAERVQATLPLQEGQDRIYDNGSAWIVHAVPETPYQP